MQMSPSQQTQSRGWLKAPSLPASASGQSQSRCLCTPRSSPLSMKVRVCYCLLSIFFSPPYQFSVLSKVVMSSMFMFSRRRLCLLGHALFFAIILFDLVFSQSLQEIPTAQLRWTPTRTAATRTWAAATSVARTWAKLSWGCSTPTLAPWWGSPGLRARLQPRYSQYFIIVVGDVF